MKGAVLGMHRAGKAESSTSGFHGFAIAFDDVHERAFR